MVPDKGGCAGRGQEVVLDEEMSYTCHKETGRIMKLRKGRGVFILDVWTKEDPSPEDSKQTPTSPDDPPRVTGGADPPPPAESMVVCPARIFLGALYIKKMQFA